MMRALWTAASGMLSQQTNLDTIGNNLSNVNTTGYKRETAEFKSLLYQTLQESSTDSDGNTKAAAIQVGSGVRNSAITSQFTQGPLIASDNPFDLGIQGDGFFAIQTASGETGYTRNGSFHMMIGERAVTLCTTAGYPVLNTQGNPIELQKEWSTSDIIIDEAGQVLHRTADGADYDLVGRIQLVQFNNPSGLTKGGGSLLYESLASGEARPEATDTGIERSTVKQNYLEASNVQAVDEMVNMIVAQRAYELNSKIITASDEMLQQANSLRR